MKYTYPISVVMPCYNSEKFVEQAIESILNQTYQSFELIIINDASTDATEARILKYKDKRIKYYRNKVNKGNYPSRNFGMSIAQGKYICMMDSDDIALVNRLQTQYDYLESHPYVGCIGGLSRTINIENVELGTINRPLSYPETKVWLLKDNFVTQPTMMIRSHLIKKHQLYYNEDFKYSSDYDFIVKSSKLFPIRNLNEILLKYRMHPSQISSEKRLEQIFFADKIRQSQVDELGVIYSDKEITLHLKLMKGEHIHQSELKKCEDWLNKLYRSNYEAKTYNAKHLYNFLKEILKFTAYNSIKNKDKTG